METKILYVVNNKIFKIIKIYFILKIKIKKIQEFNKIN